MPWLQLEDDNLDLVTSAKTAKPQSTDLSLSSSMTPTVVVVVSGGREKGKGEREMGREGRRERREESACT